MNNFDLLSMLKINAETDFQILDRLSDFLFCNGYVKESFREAIKLRERSFPTGLPTNPIGVAIPHADRVHVKSNALLTVTFEHPVQFGLMGGGLEELVDVQLAFVILVSNADDQVSMLMKLMNIIQNQTELLRICRAKTDYEINEILMDSLPVNKSFFGEY